MRNFSRAFIDGCTNLKASALKEHASSLMHQISMLLYKKSQSVPVTLGLKLYLYMDMMIVFDVTFNKYIIH